MKYQVSLYSYPPRPREYITVILTCHRMKGFMNFFWLTESILIIDFEYACMPVADAAKRQVIPFDSSHPNQILWPVIVYPSNSMGAP